MGIQNTIAVIIRILYTDIALDMTAGHNEITVAAMEVCVIRFLFYHCIHRAGHNLTAGNQTAAHSHGAVHGNIAAGGGCHAVFNGTAVHIEKCFGRHMEVTGIAVFIHEPSTGNHAVIQVKYRILTAHADVAGKALCLTVQNLSAIHIKRTAGGNIHIAAYAALIGAVFVQTPLGIAVTDGPAVHIEDRILGNKHAAAGRLGIAALIIGYCFRNTADNRTAVHIKCGIGGGSNCHTIAAAAAVRAVQCAAVEIEFTVANPNQHALTVIGTVNYQLAGLFLTTVQN